MRSDYTLFTEYIRSVVCIISVEVFSDGSYGNICIHTANPAFIQITGKCGKDFIPDQPYEKYMPRDLNFENLCYRSAVGGETLHTYMHPDSISEWIYLTVIPLNSDRENIYYCAYLQEFTDTADYSRMTNISPDSASQVLSICMKLRDTTDFMATISEIIADVRNMCDAEHCCILLSDSAQRKCSVLCEALSDNTNLTSMKNYVDDDFIDIVNTWHDTIAGNNCAIIKDEHDWEYLKVQNPVWYNSIKPAGARNIVLFPLKYRDEAIGHIWAINFDVAITLKIREMLELTTFFLASEIANHQLFDRLELLGSKDVLTGVFNRNAMNNRIDRFLSEEGRDADRSVGLIFADLNGLKTVNDLKGHYTGDLLLKDAALTLQKHFPDNEIYRAGGDEFLVLAMDADKDAFERSVQDFREAVSDPDKVCFAVGWSYDKAENIRKALRQADENMYADKQLFYERHPERKQTMR